MHQTASQTTIPQAGLRRSSAPAAPEPIPLFRTAAPPDAVARVLDYAGKLAPCGLLASRRAVEPAVLVDVLPSVFLIDVDPATGSGRWRLVGEALRPFLGGAPRGRGIDAVGPPGFRVLLAGALRTIWRDRCPIALDGLAGTGGTAERRLRFDVALVPLADDGRRVNAALGALVWRPIAQPRPASRGWTEDTASRGATDGTASGGWTDSPAALAGAMAEESPQGRTDGEADAGAERSAAAGGGGGG